MDGGAFARRARNRAFLTLLLAGAAFAGGLVLSTYMMRARSGPASETLPPIAAVPDFRFTERGGASVGLSDLRGKVWIADFFFTSCPGPCPLLSAHMKALQEALAQESDVRLVSFTIDPERDTVEALRAYAERFSADPAKWLFLRPDREEAVVRLSNEGFKLAASAVPKDDADLAKFDHAYHSVRLSLVDREGRIRGSYNTVDADFKERLLRDVKTLLAEKARA